MNRATASILIGSLVLVALVLGGIGIWHMHRASDDAPLSASFTYDLESLRRIDPALILYQESAMFRSGLQDARAIAIDATDRVYVAGDQSIRQTDGTGRLSAEIALTATPNCLTIATDRIFVGTQDHVLVYSQQGELLAEWESLGARAHLTAIATADKHVFVADAGNRIVWHFDTDGNLLNRLGDRDEERNIPGFLIPNPYFDLAVAPDGLLRVVNPGKHRIEAYTFDGDLEVQWGDYSASIEGFCGCCNPVNIAIAADGSYITAEKGLVRVKLYEPDGSFAGVVAGPEAFDPKHACEESADCDPGALDVAVDSIGRVFVLDPLSGDVHVFTKT